MTTNWHWFHWFSPQNQKIYLFNQVSDFGFIWQITLQMIGIKRFKFICGLQHSECQIKRILYWWIFLELSNSENFDFQIKENLSRGKNVNSIQRRSSVVCYKHPNINHHIHSKYNILDNFTVDTIHYSNSPLYIANLHTQCKFSIYNGPLK